MGRATDRKASGANAVLAEAGFAVQRRKLDCRRCCNCAPHASLRARVTACAGKPVAAMAPVTVPTPDPPFPAAPRRRASLHWARLLARIYEIRPLTCPRCQGPMRLIAFLTDPASIRTILAHLGEPTTPPPLTPRARAPPDREAEPVGSLGFAFDQSPSWDPTAAAPDPDFAFDQTAY